MKYQSICFLGKLSFACAMFALSIVGCSKEERAPAVYRSSSGAGVVAKTTVLATIADNDKPGTVDPASGNRPTFLVVFNNQGKGVAYAAKISNTLHVVHNGKVGRSVRNLDALSISPDGRRVAYGADIDGKWRMVIDDKVGVLSDEVGEPVFSPDSRHIAYKSRAGEQWHMVVDNMTSAGCKGIDGKPVFSADSHKIAYVEKTDDKGGFRLVISDLTMKSQDVKEASGAQLLANAYKTRVAAVKAVGKKQRVIQFSFDQPDAVTEGLLYDAVSNLVFASDGVSLSYVGEREGKRFLVLSGREAHLPDGNLPAPPVVRPDGKGVGIIIAANGRYFLYQAFPGDGAKEKNVYDEAGDLTYSRDGSLHAYAARKGSNWFIVVNGKEGPAFDRVIKPLFSPDGKYLVYRARKDGKRFVVVADADGKILRQHAAYEQVFQPVFTADGKSVAYGVKDGSKLIWKVEKL